jgi:uncharacterized protein (TIRG00374 family)
VPPSSSAALKRVRALAGSVWVRALVSAVLLAVVAVRIDFGRAVSRLSGSSWLWIVAAVLALVGSIVLGALRWRLFLVAAGVGASSADAVRANFIGMFTTNFLPSQIGGDVTRAWVVSKPGMRTRSVTSVVIDRMTALACLVLAAWLAVASEPGHAPGALLGALGVAAVVVIVAWLVTGLFVHYRKRDLTAGSSRVGTWANEAQDAAGSCLRRPVLTPAMLLGLPFQGLVMLAAWLVARSIGLRVPFSVLAATLPLVFIVSALPISIGGLGVREASYVVLLGRAGVTTTDAALLSVLFGLSFTVATLPGGLALLPKRRRAPTAQ